MAHVVRIDSPKSHSRGWQVRLGEGRTRFFADRKYGGTEEAEREARLLAAQVPTTKKARAVQSNNRSRIPGIRPCYRTYSHKAYLYIQVSWSEPKKEYDYSKRKHVMRPRACSTAFSVAKYGPLGAVERALVLRASKTGEPMPCSARQAWEWMKPLIEAKEQHE